MPEKLSPKIIPVGVIILLALLIYGVFAHDSASQVASNSYDPSRICDVEDAALNHRDADITYFDVKLTPGCFSGFIHPPLTWKTFSKQFITNEPDRHVGIWFFGWTDSQGPYLPGAFPDYPNPPTSPDGRAAWRLEGVGTIRYTETSGSPGARHTSVQTPTGSKVWPSAPPDSARPTVGGAPAPESVATPAPPVVAAPEIPPAPVTSRIMDDFLFKLDGCVLEADLVTCTLKVTNRSQDDHDLSLWGEQSRIIDEQGNPHKGGRVTLGSAGCNGRRAGTIRESLVIHVQLRSGCTVQERLPAAIPVALKIEFPGVPESQTIPLLEIGLSGSKQVSFRSVPLSK